MGFAIACRPGLGEPSSRPAGPRDVTVSQHEPVSQHEAGAARVGPVRDAATFGALRRSSRRVRTGPLTVTFVGAGPGPAPRVAYAVGRKVGGAVVRNRVRRRLRAICSELGPHMAPGAYLVAAAPEAARSSFAELRACVSQAVLALAKGRGP